MEKEIKKMYALSEAFMHFSTPTDEKHIILTVLF